MLKGSLVALVTPMFEDGEVDIEKLRALIEWHIEEGSDGIVVTGTTGESATLSWQERALVIKHACEQAAGRVPIIAGSGCNATRETIELTAQALHLGADACLLVTPYYNKPTQAGLIQHYQAVARAVPIPQILYNVPGRTACDLTVETVAVLAQHENIVGIKEATGQLDRLHRLKETCPDHFVLLSGDDATACDFILQEGQGVISVTANVAPRLMYAMCQCALVGDTAKAYQINRQLIPLHQALFLESNPIPVKWALNNMGKIDQGLRLPLTVLAEQYHDKLRSALKTAGVF